MGSMPFREEKQKPGSLSLSCEEEVIRPIDVCKLGRELMPEPSHAGPDLELPFSRPVRK